nr:hypothetical protein [Tanacetum cinerariifolium]
EGAPLQPSMLVDGDVWPIDTHMSVSSPANHAIDLPNGIFRAAVVEPVIMDVSNDEGTLLHATLRGVAARMIYQRVTTPSADVASKVVEHARASHDILCNLLFPDVSRLRGEAVTLRNQQFDPIRVISKLASNLEKAKNKLNESAKKAIKDDLDLLHARSQRFEEMRLFTLPLREKAMMVGRSQALKEVASLGVGLELEDMKDFDPNAKETYDKVVDAFYQVRFHYVDLIVHYVGQSVGNFMTLKL